MPPTIKDVDERYAQAVEGIHQRLEKFERFQLEMTARMAAIDASIGWIIRIGAFIGAATMAVAGSLLYMSYRAGHVEEAVSTLQGEMKTLQVEMKGQEALITKEIKDQEALIAKEMKGQEALIAKVLTAVESIEKRIGKDTSPPSSASPPR